MRVEIKDPRIVVGREIIDVLQAVARACSTAPNKGRGDAVDAGNGGGGGRGVGSGSDGEHAALRGWDRGRRLVRTETG